MRLLELAKRNVKELIRDPLSLALIILLPAVLLAILQGIEDAEGLLTPVGLYPGVTYFGFAMITFSAAMTLGQDRETALFARLLTAPLRSNQFLAAYSLPYLPIAIVLAGLLLGVGAIFGLDVTGSLVLALFIVLIMAVLYIGLGLLLGSLLSYRAVPGAWAAVLILTIFGGAWFDLDVMGSAIKTSANVLPFAHAIDATRSVMADGASFGDISTDLVWIVGYTIVIVALAVVSFRRRMLE